VGPRLLESASIPERYRRCSFENFKTDDPDEGRSQQLLGAKRLSQRYVDEFVTDEGRFSERGLLFSGPTGVGKTHLAVSVLRGLIERYRIRALFSDCTALLHRLQNTFERDAERGKSDVLRPVLSAEILVLDDLGAQKSSEWVREILYLVLNERYSARLPTILTTNLRLDSAPADAARTKLDSSATSGPRRASMRDRLDASLVSRLAEMTRPVRIEAGDFRREIKSSAF
jgi:DNA replication protein DnaC